MSTRFAGGGPQRDATRDARCVAARRRRNDPAELLAIVARAKREMLLRAHRHRLRSHDLEDCYDQATLELLSSVRRGRRFEGREHLANALEQRFLARVRDQLRATRGRSAAHTLHERALALGDITESQLERADARANVHELVASRLELERLLHVVPCLSTDQRLAIASQVAGVGCSELCGHAGWSAEKYRKVAQRGRARLRALMSEHPAGVAPTVTAEGATTSSAHARSEGASRMTAHRRSRS